MDFSKRKVRFNLEPLDPREVPALLVGLPDAAGPEVEVVQVAKVDPGPGSAAAGPWVDEMSLNFPKIVFENLPTRDSLSAGDVESAGKVQFQDISFTKVQFQDINFTSKVNKPSPTL